MYLKSIHCKKEYICYMFCIILGISTLAMKQIPILFFFSGCFILLILIHPSKYNFYFFAMIIFTIHSALSAVMIVAFFLSAFYRRQIHLQLDGIAVSLSIFISLKLLSFFIAADKMLAIYDIGVWFVLFLLFIIIKNQFSSDYTLIKYLAIGAFILVFLYIVKAYNLQMFLDINHISGISIPDTNVVAMICFILFLLLDQANLDHGALVWNVVLFQCVLLVGILVTASRAVQIFTGLWILYRIVSSYIKRLNKAKLVLIFFSMFFLFYLVHSSSFFQERIKELESITDMNMYSNHIRILLYQDVLKISLKEHPLIGFGARNFAAVYPIYQTIPFSADHAHNTYLQIFFEQGIIGLLSYFSLIVFIYRKLFLWRKRNKTFFIVYFYIFSCCFLFSLVEHIFVTSGLCYIFMISLANVSYQRKSNEITEF